MLHLRHWHLTAGYSTLTTLDSKTGAHALAWSGQPPSFLLRLETMALPHNSGCKEKYWPLQSYGQVVEDEWGPGYRTLPYHH